MLFGPPPLLSAGANGAGAPLAKHEFKVAADLVFLWGCQAGRAQLFAHRNFRGSPECFWLDLFDQKMGKWGVGRKAESVLAAIFGVE